MSKNPYEILHLEEDATYDEIKERYRHLTKNLHPDKQPLENYQITKKLFEQIDEAYKSIASPLRRYLFREYGLPALRILEEMPGEFEEYDVEQLTPEQIVKLRQLMIYMLYEREAGLEMDKTKFNTKTMMNISKMMRPKQVKTPSKRNLSFPEIENANFDYEMVLPEVRGFSNSLAVSHVGSNLRNDPKSQIGFTVSSMRRLYTTYMLAIQGMVATDESTLDVTVDKIFENNLHLKFTPLSLYNLQLARPKISVEKAFNQFQFAAITDFASSNFQFTESNSKPVSKSLKVYTEEGSLGLLPKVEWQMGPDLRFYVQLSIGANFNQGNISLHQSLLYGYKLMLNNDLKLQLTSSMGYPNYFQICLSSSKFRAAIPFATAEPEQSRFQMMKIATMVLVYFCYEAYHFQCRRNKRIREKVIKEQHNRLTEQYRELQKQLSYVEMSAVSRRDKEVRYDGLVIVRAFLGEKKKLKQFQQRITKAGFKKNCLGREGLQECEQKISDLIFVSGDIGEEVCNITLMVQNEVKGSQMIDFDLEELHKYNPCIFDNIRPYVLLVYLQRGEFKTLLRPCKGKISLGGFRDKKVGLGTKLSRAWKRVVNSLIN